MDAVKQFFFSDTQRARVANLCTNVTHMLLTCSCKVLEFYV